MSSQQKFFLILIILAGLLLIGGGLIGWFYWQNNQGAQSTVNNNQATNQSAQTTNTGNNQNTNADLAADTNSQTGARTMKDEDWLAQLARSFTERYGSFSNQNDFENLLDLKIYMTEKMQAEVDKVVADNNGETVGENDYYGITTKVLSVEKVNLTENEAIYTVQTQRKESSGLTSQSYIYGQEARIEFKKVDQQWKVSQFNWK